MEKLNIGSAKKSIIYRQDAEIKIRKIMEGDPYISLIELEKKSGYSRQTISYVYLKIRRSSEWKIWINNLRSNNLRSNNLTV